MPDIIQLLPDTVANQIAAGEVVQRPASVVKELVENSIDAGSEKILVIIKDAGKTLIQINDDGKGMSETDARLSLERHATSKIRQADDLFRITTKGFRGEALASITAIAQVELKTRQADDSLGVLIEVEGNKVITQEPVQCAKGTGIKVKNLFYNVPARRNFLKSDVVEFNAITDEFLRVALAHPEIAFSLEHNGNEVYRVEKSTIRQRVANLMGANYNEKLVPVKEETDLVKINGFVVKPEFSKKRRGEQYFFLNNRFIKNAYLHHAVMKAYEQLLPSDSFPSYFLFIEVDPSFVDVNIHPTKTEVKFEDEKAIYLVLRSTIKRSLGIYNIAPTLDFEQEKSHDFFSNSDLPPKAPTIRVNPDFNPFQRELNLKSGISSSSNDKQFRGLTPETTFDQTQKAAFDLMDRDRTRLSPTDHLPKEETDKEENGLLFHEEDTSNKHLQVAETYIFSRLKTGVMVIHQQFAHQRILYDRVMNSEQEYHHPSQRLIFPMLHEFRFDQVNVIKEHQQFLQKIGFDIQNMGGNSMGIIATPVGIDDQKVISTLESLLEDLIHLGAENTANGKAFMATLYARNFCIKRGQKLDLLEMQNLVDELFGSSDPYFSPEGKAILYSLTLEEISKKFR
jgi:DNA mismatch repair protein MutL